MSNINKNRVGIIGVPLGFGASKTGSELGVEAIRLSPVRGNRLLEHITSLGIEVEDFGNVPIQPPKTQGQSASFPKHLEEMAAASEAIRKAVYEVLTIGAMPIILGGDHSIAIGSFSAVSQFHREKDEPVGLIWFDAHADINTPETSTTGNIHGMPLAVLFGEGDEKLVNIGGFSPKLDKKYFAHVGARDIDPGEKSQIHSLGLKNQFFTMSDIDKRGMTACVSEAIEIAGAAPGGFAVTFDIDMIDPRFAPGSGTLVRGGATYREAHLALEIIAESDKLRSFEIVEVNPLLDKSNITVELAIELILSVLGKTIL
ncbi:MAG TPA: arginase [Pyrinomonadaceae bacterium]|jgi:arginase|nr:arginase [Pyrinomonadaceae bacterium]